MSVNKYKIQIGDLQNSKKLKIPLTLDFGSVDQSEVVNREFVDDEVEKSINPIIDYEQTRFIPILTSGDKVKNLNYKLFFLDDNDELLSPTNYSDIGFVDGDIKFNKNKFKKSFLRLSFYDSDIPTNQNLVSFITIFCRVYLGDLIDMSDNGVINPLGGTPKSANLIPVRFLLTDPILEPEGFHEGFYLYYFKNELKKGDKPKNLYMRAEFNNAATGKTTRFITSPDTLPINEVVNKLHTKYLLTRTNSGYYYSIDLNYNNVNNVTENAEKITINLYEIKVQ